MVWVWWDDDVGVGWLSVDFILEGLVCFFDGDVEEVYLVVVLIFNPVLSIYNHNSDIPLHLTTYIIFLTILSTYNIV